MSGSKPVPFPYKNNNMVPWRYAPPKPSKRKEKTTDIDSLLAKVTNITGLSDVTRNGHIFAPPDLPARPSNAKGKAKVIEEHTNKASPVPDEDVPTGRLMCHYFLLFLNPFCTILSTNYSQLSN